jgi:flagellar biogenesis protein FliO
VAETVSLGEKRFVAVVQVDGRHFLLAGGATNIALLAQLDAKDDFGDVLKKTLTSRKQSAKRRRTAPAGEPSNIALRTNLNGAQISEQSVKKTTTAGKQPPKRTRKQNPRPEELTNAPMMAHVNGKEAFGDLLNQTMTAPPKPPAKQTGKPNYAPAIERIGEYA